MEVCRNCGGKLIIKSTKRTPEQQKKSYYFTAYYYCPNCKKLYHDEKFKVTNKVSHPERLKVVEGSPTLFEKDSIASLQNDNTVEIWTDGACIYNGTPRARAAWAFVTRSTGSGQGGKTERAGLVDGLQTNNRAEALAIYYALVWSAEKGFRKIKLHTDSQISIHGVSKDPRKVVKNREIFEQIAQVVKGCHLDVTYVKVLGHSGEPNNDRVDKLANDLARNG